MLERYGETSLYHQVFFRLCGGGRAKASTIATSPWASSPGHDLLLGLRPSARRFSRSHRGFQIATSHYAMGFG